MPALLEAANAGRMPALLEAGNAGRMPALLEAANAGRMPAPLEAGIAGRMPSLLGKKLEERLEAGFVDDRDIEGEGFIAFGTAAFAAEQVVGLGGD